MAEYDLSSKFVVNLDRHIVYQLLDFLAARKIYKDEDITRAKFNLLSGTKMVEAAEEEYKKLNGTENARPEIQQQSDEVIAELERRKSDIAPLVAIIEDQDEYGKLVEANSFHMSNLRVNYKIAEDALPNLYHYAKFLYECGQYSDASLYLQAFLYLTDDNELRYQALWGKLAVEIQTFSWDVALEDVKTLCNAIDDRQYQISELEQLQQRTWLLHWCMFPFFKAADGPSRLLDFIYPHQKLLNTLQITSPHLIRYLGAAMVISKQHKTHMRDMVRLLKQERDVYSDPITRFLTTLLVDFEFNSVPQHLQDSSAVIKNDYFLADLHDQFIEQSRSLIFETICKVHKCISIEMLVKCMNLEEKIDEKEMHEQQIIELIRKTNTYAKIDISKNQLIVTTTRPSVHRTVLAKTRGLFDDKPDKSRKFKKPISKFDGDEVVDNEEHPQAEAADDASRWDNIMMRLTKKLSGRA